MVGNLHYIPPLELVGTLNLTRNIAVNATGAVEQLATGLAQAHNYGLAKQPPTEFSAVAGLTIALTREAGTPGTTIAREAARQLGWQAYDHELLEIIGREKGVRLSLLEGVDEQVRSSIVTFAESFGGAPAVTEFGYYRDLVETILLLAARGRCVIVGRGAAFLLPRATTLRVRLIGERPDRVRAAGEERGLAPAEAERWVAETDKHRQRFIQRHFGLDATNPTHYDLVLNAPRWTVAQAAGLIVEAARRRTEN
jgi:hypothetical protein